MFQKSSVTTFIAFLILSFSAFGLEDAPSLPDEFAITERMVSLVSTFDLGATKDNLGTVKKTFFAVADIFTWTKDGKTVATGRKQLLSWGATVDVTDGKGEKVGQIKEQVFKSLFKWSTVYSLIDADGKVVAESEKVDWLATKFTLKDKKGVAIATIQRRLINFLNDKWSVKIADHKIVDARLLVLIGIFKTDVDNQRRAAAAVKSSSNNK